MATFQSINTFEQSLHYDYTITLIEKKYLLIRIEWTWIPITQRCFVPCLVEISASVLEKKNFKISSMYLLYFIVISFWKRMWPFILTKFNPLHPKMLCIKFCWNWLSGFINFILVFSLIHYYLLSEEGMTLHLNKLESPSSKDAFYQVWLKLAMWFWRRRRKCEKFTTTMKTTDNGQSELKMWLIKGGSKIDAPCGSPLLKKNCLGLFLLMLTA